MRDREGEGGARSFKVRGEGGGGVTNSRRTIIICSGLQLGHSSPAVRSWRIWIFITTLL